MSNKLAYFHAIVMVAARSNSPRGRSHQIAGSIALSVYAGSPGIPHDERAQVHCGDES